jgi:hypothetical protein
MIKASFPWDAVSFHRESMGYEVGIILRESEETWRDDTLKDRNCTVHVAEIPTIRLKILRARARNKRGVSLK